MFIIDTDILVDHLRGYCKAKDFLEKFEINGLQGNISIISVIEWFAGKRIANQNDVDKIVKLLDMFNQIDVNFSITKKSGEIVRIYNCSIPDAVIAASAKTLNLKIVTRNKKHYEMIKEVEIKIPYK